MGIVFFLPQLILLLYIDAHVPLPHLQTKMIQLATIIQYKP